MLDTFDLREEQAHERLCGIALMQLDRQAEAKETLEACLRDAEWERDRYAAALISSWLCGVCNELGEYADALQYIDDAIVFARNGGNRVNEARYHRQRGMTLRLNGRSSEGIVSLREAVRLQRIVNPDAVGMFILHASLCALDVGCAEEARSLYASWDLRPVHKVNALWMVRALAGSCVAFAALGDERGHRRAKRRTLHALGFTDLPAVRVQVQAYLGRAAWLLGDEASARSCVEAARAEAPALASRPGCVELFELRWLQRALGGARI